MDAMCLETLGAISADSEPLVFKRLPTPAAAPGEVLIHVAACGVCHTELDEIEGRLPPAELPRILGHQVVGHIASVGDGVSIRRPGERVGVGWIASACGECEYCCSGRENLCADFCCTGLDIDGGYAEYMVVDARYAVPLPEGLEDIQAAPMLCAGAIGYRSLSLAGIENGQRLGLTGFGGSAHLVLPLARHLYPDSPVYVFARDEQSREFARSLGADWAGDTADAAPQPLHAIIDTTPAWLPVVSAMSQLLPGGRLVINAIRKEDRDNTVLTSLDYPRDLWREKEIKTVANVTRRDIVEFLRLAAEAGIRPEVECFSLRDANRALVSLKTRQVRGAKVLVMDGDAAE